MLRLILVLVLVLFVYGCTNEQSNVKISVQEACELPKNYEIRIIKSPEFKKWKIRKRNLKQKK